MRASDPSLRRLVPPPLARDHRAPRRGRALVPVAAALAACEGADSPTAPPTPTVTASFAGQAVAAGAFRPTGLCFVARTTAAPTARDFATPLGTDGAFQLTAALPGTPADSLRLVVDALPGTARVFQPVLLASTLGAAPRALRPLLVPRRVTVPAGSTYAGTAVDLSLRAAFTPVCADATEANCNSFFPAGWRTGGVAVWPDSVFPVPVAFNRAASAAAIAPAASVAF